MRLKRTLMTQLEYALHQPTIDMEMAKAADGNLGFRFFTRSGSAQSKSSQYRNVKRRAARAAGHVARTVFKKQLLRRPRATESSVHRRRERLRGSVGIPYSKAKLVRAICFSPRSSSASLRVSPMPL